MKSPGKAGVSSPELERYYAIRARLEREKAEAQRALILLLEVEAELNRWETEIFSRLQGAA